MNQRLCFISLFLFNIQFLIAQDTLTVETAVQRVLANHPAILQAQQQMQASKARVKQAESANLPKAAVEASYTRLGPAIPFYFGSFGPLQFYPLNNYDAHIGADYSLVDFGRTSAAIDVAQSHVQAAQNSVELIKRNLGYQTIRTFYSILFIKKSIVVADEQIETLNEHIVLTKKKVAAGTATDFDVLTTQVRVASAQNRKVELENSLHQQESFLRQLLGTPETALPVLQGEFTLTNVSMNTDSLTQTAFTQRIEMKLAQDALHSADLQYSLTSRGNLPSLHIHAEFGAKNGLFLPNLDIIRGNWVASAQLRIPVFEGNLTYHREEEAQALSLAEQAHILNTERQIRNEVDQAVDNIKSAVENLNISQVQVKQASEAVKIALKRYEIGSGTNIDLLDAEATESEAKLNNLRSLFKCMMSAYELDQETGKEL